MLKQYERKITSLYGHDPMSKYKVLLCFFLQLATCYYIKNASWPVLLLAAWLWGGTINHSLMLAVHELSHDLFFADPKHNTWFGIFASLPLAIPISQGFKKYHLIHHATQGYEGIDPDLPTKFEGNFFRTIPAKLLFVFFQPLIYVFRPLLLMSTSPTVMEIVAYGVQAVFNFAILSVFGGKALAYLFLSAILGSGFHPLAAHFIAEHYVWNGIEETYSYYGPLNALVYNVGYHNEHHDFPRIPGSRLPKLHKIAPEFYENIPTHSSWPMVIVNFIFDPSLSPFNRVVRKKVEPTPQ
jgi:sphingolipid delta-4 desaturase